MSAPKPMDRHEIEETASRWVMRREESGWSGHDQAALEAWLGESMAHKAAFWRLEHGWRQADRLGSLGDAVAPTRPRFTDKWTGRSWQPLAIAASIALILAAILGYPRGPSRSRPVEIAQQTIATQVGMHKRVPLADGSQIELNTATVLRAAVTADKREVWLDRGEAYFEVRHSDRVPFVVHAGSRTVTVLGTKFSVRREGDKVTVSVVEGRVRVDPGGSGAPGREVASGSFITVSAGDIAIVDGKSTLVAERSSERVESALAWRGGMLSFDQSPLAEVAKEFNRYNDRKLVISDPAAASIRIGGTFQASNVDAFVRLLRDAYSLRVEANDREVKISS